jgi:energy-coupling factor transport system ATP-binding protein
MRGLSVTWTDGRGAGAATALHDVSLSIDAGEVVGIVGETGSGRSTLLRCLIGIVPHLVPAAVEGDIAVAGRDPRVTPVAEMARDVAIVLDDPEAQVSQATVAEEVALGLENLAVPVAEMRARVRRMLEQVGLAGFEDRHPLTLSGGEQQRLAVACAVAVRPRLLLLDEPTGNLDPRAGRRLLGLVRDLAMERGITVVIVEHDVELLAEHVDRIVVLDAGRVRLDATPAAAFTALARSDPMASVPQVTAFAACLDPTASLLPVTTEGAVRWLAGRA